MLIVRGSFRNEKPLHWRAFRRDTSLANVLSLLIGIVPVPWLPASPAFLSIINPPQHVSHRFTLVRSIRRRKRAVGLFARAPPQSLDQRDFTASDLQREQEIPQVIHAEYCFLFCSQSRFRRPEQMLFVFVGLVLADW